MEANAAHMVRERQRENAPEMAQKMFTVLAGEALRHPIIFLPKPLILTLGRRRVTSSMPTWLAPMAATEKAEP